MDIGAVRNVQWNYVHHPILYSPLSRKLLASNLTCSFEQGSRKNPTHLGTTQTLAQETSGLHLSREVNFVCTGP